ncbi:MAG: nucleoside deaminase [Desulfobacteraceae bacterium]
MTNHHEKYMAQALDLARAALDRDEFPVGCVMVHEGRIIAQGERTGTRGAVPSEIDHAEIIALRRLESLTAPIDRKEIAVYATLEPCLMCFGALLISGIGTLVYAYEDAMGGGTACDRTRLPALYRDNDLRIIPHVGRSESLTLLQDFFTKPHIDYWRNSYLEAYTLAQSC